MYFKFVDIPSNGENKASNFRPSVLVLCQVSNQICGGIEWMHMVLKDLTNKALGHGKGAHHFSIHKWLFLLYVAQPHLVRRSKFQPRILEVWRDVGCPIGVVIIVFQHTIRPSKRLMFESCFIH